MRCVSKWRVLVLLAATLVSLGPAAMPAAASRAPSLPAGHRGAAKTTAEEQIVLVDSTGRVVVYSYNVQSNTKTEVWSSGTDTGYNRVATGDFDGDGFAEIVAVKDTVLTVWDPTVRSGETGASWSLTTSTDQKWRLLTTGDFDGDGRDEIAVTREAPGSHEELLVYDGGSGGTPSEWKNTFEWMMDYALQDFASGNVNGDVSATNNPFDDLAMIRTDGWIKFRLGPDFREVPPDDNRYDYPWKAIAVGRLATAWSGDQIVLSRDPDGDNWPNRSLVFLHYQTGAGCYDDLCDVNGSDVGWDYRPSMISVATADVNGDGKDEALMVRHQQYSGQDTLVVDDPVYHLQMLSRAIGDYDLVRGGDLDGDGRDEIVTLRSDGYVVFDDANTNYAQSNGGGGSFKTLSMAIANVTGSYTPRLAVSQTSATFNVTYGQASPTTAVGITNAGGGDAINWTASVLSTNNAQKWLRVNGGTSASGTTPGTLNITVITTAMEPGQTWEAKPGIRVTSNDANVDPNFKTFNIDVSMTLADPGFYVSPTSISVFQGSDDPVAISRTVQLILPLGGPITWSAAVLGTASDAVAAQIESGEIKVDAAGQLTGTVPAAAPSWLTVSPMAGQVSEGAPQAVTLAVNRQGLSFGTYRATVVFGPSTGTVRPISVTYMYINHVNRIYAPMIYR